MTELICHVDSYIRDFSAHVAGVQADQHLVVLDRTAFYPGGGGQPCDVGTLMPDYKSKGRINKRLQIELAP